MTSSFKLGALITHKETGEWLIYAGPVTGESAGFTYSYHTAFTLLDAKNSGRRAFARSNKELKSYRLVGREEAHETLQALYRAIAVTPQPKQVRRQHEINKVLDLLMRARDTSVPATVARVMKDTVNLLTARQDGILFRYGRMFDETAYLIAHWTRAVYGTSIEKAYDNLLTLKIADPKSLFFAYQPNDVILSSRQSKNVKPLRFTARSSFLNLPGIRDVERREVIQKAASRFVASQTKDFGLFSVDIDTQGKKPKYLISAQNINIRPNAFALLEILYDQDDFISKEDILARDEQGVFEGKEGAVTSAYNQLRVALRRLPRFKDNPYLVNIRTHGMRFFKKDEEIIHPVERPDNYKPKTLLDADFNVMHSRDFGHFVVETDYSRSGRQHRVAGTKHYILASNFKLLELLHDNPGVPFKPDGLSLSGQFQSASGVMSSFRFLRTTLNKAGVKDVFGFLQQTDKGEIVFFKPGDAAIDAGLKHVRRDKTREQTQAEKQAKKQAPISRNVPSGA